MPSSELKNLRISMYQVCRQKYYIRFFESGENFTSVRLCIRACEQVNEGL